MKYIMLKIVNGGLICRTPIIFPNSLVHSDVAAAMEKVIGLQGSEPVSAGDCTVFVSSAFGESTTLGLSADEKDMQIINMHDYFHGIVIEEEEESTKRVFYGTEEGICSDDIEELNRRTKR